MPINGYIDTVFADTGDVTAVPDGTQSDGSVSYQQGFTPSYSTPVASGGRDFPRAQNNQILKDISTAVQFLQQNGASNFITTAMNGGIDPYSYTLGAVVAYDAGSGLENWISTAAANTTTPGAGGAHWVPLGTVGITENAQVATSYAPTTSDIGKIIVRSNAASPMADIIPGTSGALPAGWYGYIQNADTSNDSVTVGSGGNIAVGNNNAADAFTIGSGETWLVISYGAGSYTAGRISAGTLHTKPPQGTASGVKGGWVSNTTFTYTANGIVLYDANGNSKIINAFNKTANSATSGIGGLSTGSIANNTWYGVYAAYNPATGAQGIFFDPSFTAPTLPTGYTYSALIGAVITDSSAHFIGFKQSGKEWQYQLGNNLSALPILATGTTSGGNWLACAVASVMPSVADIMKAQLANSNPGASTGLYASVAPNNGYALNSATLGGLSSPLGVNVSASYGAIGLADIILESSNIYYASTLTTAYLACFGFILNI